MTLPLGSHVDINAPVSFFGSIEKRVDVRYCQGDGEAVHLLPHLCIGYVNGSCRSLVDASCEGYTISEGLGSQPVYLVWNSGSGLVCGGLIRGGGGRIDSENKTVLALVSLWKAFFSSPEGSHPDSRFLQIYYGDGGCYVKAALFACVLEPFFQRIRCIGLAPLEYMPLGSNSMHYRVAGDPFSLCRYKDYSEARTRGEVLTIKYASNLAATIPNAWDASFMVVLRTEFMEITGTTTLFPGMDMNPSEKLLLVLARKACLDPSKRIKYILQTYRTQLDCALNPSPGGVFFMGVWCLSRFFDIFSTICLSPNPQSLDYFFYGLTAAYNIGAIGQIILWSTNGQYRALRYRKIRVLARFLTEIGRWTMLIDLEEFVRRMIMFILDKSQAPASIINMHYYVVPFMTVIVMVDGSSAVCPRIFSTIQRQTMRFVCPNMYEREKNLQTHFTKRSFTAARTTNSVIGMILFGCLLQLMIAGIDISLIALPTCSNSTGSMNSTGNSTHCVERWFGNVKSDIKSTWESGGVRAITKGFQFIWCCCLMILYLFLTYREIIRSRYQGL